MSISLQSRMVQRVQRKEGSHKIHLLHLINSLIIGGAEVALLHYIQALGQENYCHYVYSFGHDGPIRKKIEALGISVYFGPKRASIKNPFKFCITFLVLVKDLLNFIKFNKIHVIHSHLGQPNQLAVLIGKLSGISAFPTIHSTNAFEDTRSSWDPRVYFIKMVNAIIYRMAERVVVVSPKIKDIIRQTYGLEDSQVVVLKNGIIIEDSFSESQPLGQEFSDSKNKLRIVAAGRLVPLKCFETLVKAVAKIVEQGQHDLLVLIIGDGEERPRLEKLIAELRVESYVKLLGLRDDVIELMREADIFVIPSSYEGLSIAMIEAMACGLPIIGSNAPGLRECINHGQNGLLFQVKDHNALAECIVRLANDNGLRASLSHGAQNSFVKEYDMRKNIITLDMLFRQYAAV